MFFFSGPAHGQGEHPIKDESVCNLRNVRGKRVASQLQICHYNFISSEDGGAILFSKFAYLIFYFPFQISKLEIRRMAYGF